MPSRESSRIDLNRSTDRSVPFQATFFCPPLLLLSANPSLFHKLPRLIAADGGRRRELQIEVREEEEEAIRSRDGTINIRQRGNLPPARESPPRVRLRLFVSPLPE